MQNILSHTRTNVRVSVMDGAFRFFPLASQRVLTGLFLRPRRKGAHTPRLGAVVDELDIEGTRVLVRATGRGPTVALVHGWQGHAGQFDRLREGLLRAGFTVVTFDMPAHGESRGRTTTIAAFIETIVQVGRRLGPLHAVVAHSMGGTATALALSRELEVNGVVLLSPMPSFDFALDEFSKILRLSPAARELTALGAERRSGYARKDVDLLTLSAPDCAVQLIHDRQDQRTPFSCSQRLAQVWPDAELVPTSGLGHRRILDDYLVIERISAFLSAMPRKPQAALDVSLSAAPTLRF